MSADGPLNRITAMPLLPMRSPSAIIVDIENHI